ncbi:alpha/beta hydrolase [Yeosuana sp. MJ-SS3]|uniref:Alpha/beta hydrolase n=1 Tax=Gilvirhabdus luticola TaxID=3079858 RepID=A0ABU3U8R8_9FLAO|nr:alpha/beta hydrolase [Yeosuana sp. MJ-SS3]MDU8886809.1 alpha/beta hydrolase [Yeosuana sp. MJ-SS3]
MNKSVIQLTIISFLILTSCSKNLTSVPDKTTEQISATYQTKKDVSYGTDAEQNMDIYLSKEAKSYGKNNYTIVFLHGGAYYLSDKSAEERYIEPYLKKGLNVVNMNYRLKKGIPIATTDLTNALNFLKANNSDYDLNLKNIIVTGFSAGAHMATNVGVSQNNSEYPNKLNDGIKIAGIINFSGPVDGLDIVEKIFVDHDNELYSKAGNALFPSEGYESKEKITVYEPITYFDKNDPPIFIWHGGKDNQIPPETFEKFTVMLNNDKDFVDYHPDALHSPTEEELKNAYIKIFDFLDNL